MSRRPQSLAHVLREGGAESTQNCREKSREMGEGIPYGFQAKMDMSSERGCSN